MSEIMKADNLGFQKPVAQNEESALTQAAESRAVAEVQASFVIAKKFPRNQHESYMNIIESCKRPFLAEQAMYAYPRGGALVTGPSIRLAEVVAQCWGHIEYGIREITQSGGVSVAEAFAIDYQSNTRVTKSFHVKHERHTKKGITKLTDPRDLYELVANQGARRVRACILGIIPGDVVEAAVNQCKKTLESGEVPLNDRIRMMVTKFDELGVKVEHLEKRLGHKLDATIPQEVVTLQAVYKSIKDGFSGREDFFDIATSLKTGDAENEIENLLAEKRNKEPLKYDKKPS